MGKRKSSEYRNVETITKVLKYWSGYGQEIDPLQTATGKFIDIGEPSCFVCGYYRDEDYYLSPDATYEECASIWNNSKYLVMHHIVPVVFGGTHDPDNLIFSCDECHREWHHYREPTRATKEQFLIWAKGQDYARRLINKVRARIDEIMKSYDITDKNSAMILFLQENIKRGDEIFANNMRNKQAKKRYREMLERRTNALKLIERIKEKSIDCSAL